MNALAHGTFVVGLEGFYFGTQLLTQGDQTGIDFVKRDGAVLSRVTLAKHVVVDAMEHEDFHGGFLEGWPGSKSERRVRQGGVRQWEG
jgi:hypothetical protein